MSFKAFIKVYDDPVYYPNGVAFGSADEAAAYGRYKCAVWTMADKFKVVVSDEPVNYTFDDRTNELKDATTTPA